MRAFAVTWLIENKEGRDQQKVLIKRPELTATTTHDIRISQRSLNKRVVLFFTFHSVKIYSTLFRAG